ncbi:MAG: hypothetical protein V1720_03735 [bacterium]
MIRSSQQTLKFSNVGKLEYLERLFKDYQADLQDYIALIWAGKLPLRQFLSSKILPEIRCNSSIYQGIIYFPAIVGLFIGVFDFNFLFDLGFDYNIALCIYHLIAGDYFESLLL